MVVVAAAVAATATVHAGLVPAARSASLFTQILPTTPTQMEYHQLGFSFQGGVPTTGTVDLTVPSYGTISAVPYNATAGVLQTALDSFFGAPGVAVAFGGPWPLVPITVRQMTLDTAATERWIVTPNNMGQTRGYDFAANKQNPADAKLPVVRLGPQGISYSKYPDRTEGTGTFTGGSQIATLDGNGSVFMQGATSTNATIVQQRLIRPVDLRGRETLALEVYNPQEFPLASTIGISNSWATNQMPSTKSYWQVSIPPGWTTILLDSTDLKTARSVIDWSTVTAAEFRIESYNNTTGDTSNPGGRTSAYLDGVYTPSSGRPKVVLTYDDGFKNQYVLAYPIMQAYPSIRHTLFVVKQWTIDGKRTGLDTSPTMTLAQLQAMKASGLCEIGNHSDKHYKYEAGINYADPSTSSAVQAIQYKPGTSGGTFTLTLPGVGTTAVLPANVACYDVKNAIRALPGAPEVLDVVGQYYTQRLGLNYGVRVTFAQPQPIMVSSNANVQVGPGHTVSTVQSAYHENAVWLRNNGLGGAEDCVAYPEGNYGPMVDLALSQQGMRCGRLFAANATNFTILPKVAAGYGKDSMPAYNFGGNLSDCIAQIERAKRVGGIFHIMFHNFTSAPYGSPGYTGTLEYQLLLEYLNRGNGVEFDVVTESELASSLGLPRSANF